MPNWAKGFIKIKGKKEDIENFLFNGIEYFGENKVTKKINEEYNEIKYVFKNNTLPVKQTARTYLLVPNKEIYLNEKFKNNPLQDIFMIHTEIQSAWYTPEEDLKLISKEFNIDFMIHTFERGVEFEEIIEIKSGEIINMETKFYEDYEWECIHPMIGG